MSVLRVQNFLLSCLCAVGVTGCGALEDMDKMKKTTQEMRDITDRLSKKTDDVSETAAILLRDARQGGAIEARARAMNSILHFDKAIEDKILHSATYFQSFEFQLWENFLTDDELRRQRLLAIGAEEFLITFRGIIGGKPPAPNPLSSDPNMHTMLALSLAVDQINLLQIEASERDGFQAISMLDLLVNSLRLIPEADETYNIPDYVKKVLVYEDEVRYLLELRYNMFSAMTLDKLYNIGKLGFLDKLLLLIKSDVDIALANLNSVELNEITHNYLAKAIEARKLMKEFGSPVRLNKTMVKILKKAKFIDDPLAGTAKAAATAAMKAAYSELLCRTGPSCTP